MFINDTHNQTNQNDQAQSSKPRPTWYWAILAVISLLAVFGNGLVIYVLAAKRRRLLTSANWFVMSLSMADFLIGLFLPSMAGFCNVYPNLCNVSLFYMFYNSMMSIAVLSIFAMTFDRFLGIVHPLHYQQWMTSKRVAMVIGIAWSLPIILSFLPLTWSGYEQEIQNDMKGVHTSAMLIIFEFLPPVLMLLMYSRILITARRHARQTAAQINQLKFNNQCASNSTRNRTERSIRVIGAVVLVFVGCWLLDIYKSICWHYKKCDIDRQLVNISVILLFFNSAVNPLVYALLKNDFKRELHKMFCCRPLDGIQSTFEMTDNKTERMTARNSVKSVYEITDYKNKSDGSIDTRTQEALVIALKQDEVLAPSLYLYSFQNYLISKFSRLILKARLEKKPFALSATQ